jgi:AcrR family transcriptional regulator
MGRAAPRREPLSRARIIDAALALADENGIENLGMRGVARRLGVDPMSLYNHVDGKSALFDGIAERLVELADLPGPAPWDDWARTAAQRFMRVALEHPGGFGVLGVHPVSTIESIAHFEPLVDGLLRAGVPESAVGLVVNALLGFVASYALVRTLPPLSVDSTQPQETIVPPEMRERLPAISRVEAAEASVILEPEATFNLGVELLIEGLRARLQRGGFASAG